MTIAGACTLLVETTRQLAIARWQREAWRTLAIKAIHEYGEITCDREMHSFGCYQRIADRLLTERDDLLAPDQSRRGRAA